MPRIAVQGVAGYECGALCRPAEVYMDRHESCEGGDPTALNWQGMPANCESGAGEVTVRPEVPGTGESCRFWWTRQWPNTQIGVSNTLGFCFNHASWRYDPDGTEPFSYTSPEPRCPDLTVSDIVPPVDVTTPLSDALYFGCMSLPEDQSITPLVPSQPKYIFDRMRPFIE